MVYAYLRVSTDKQDAINQRLGIEELAKKKNLVIDEYIDDEGVSGTKEPEKRKLGALLHKMQKGDVLIAGEISRLGRTLFMVMRILEYCMNNGIKVYTAKDGYELGDNITSKVLAFAFGLSAEIERDMISRRTKEALEVRKQNGAKLGRHSGDRCHLNRRCEKQDKYISESFANKVPKVQIAKSVGVSTSTLYRYLVYKGMFDPKNCNKKQWTEYGVYH